MLTHANLLPLYTILNNYYHTYKNLIFLLLLAILLNKQSYKFCDLGLLQGNFYGQRVNLLVKAF